MSNAIVDRATSKLLAAAIALTLLPGQASAVVSAPELPNPGHTGMSRQQQIQLGYQSAAQVYKQMPVLPDNSPETLYVRQLGAKLVATIPQQYTWPYEFHVVAQKEINAFALPGGPMFINIGTITAADNEAELAGVMAHEMSHVYMQHSARQVAKAKETGIFAGIAEAVAGATLGGVGGELAQEGIQFGAQGMMLKYSRGDEAQADAVGAIIVWKAGYNPQALADFFKKLEQQDGGAGPQFLSDHPIPATVKQPSRRRLRIGLPSSTRPAAPPLHEQNSTLPALGRTLPRRSRKAPSPGSGPGSTKRAVRSSSPPRRLLSPNPLRRARNPAPARFPCPVCCPVHGW